jgi:hypothetical protein
MAAEEVVVAAIFRAAREGHVDIVAAEMLVRTLGCSPVWKGDTLLRTASWHGHVG